MMNRKLTDEEREKIERMSRMLKDLVNACSEMEEQIRYVSHTVESLNRVIREKDDE